MYAFASILLSKHPTLIVGNTSFLKFLEYKNYTQGIRGKSISEISSIIWKLELVFEEKEERLWSGLFGIVWLVYLKLMLKQARMLQSCGW